MAAQHLKESRVAGRAGPALTRARGASQAAEVWYEGSASQEIVWSVSTDRGLSWGPRRTLVTPASDLPVWAPVLHVQARACTPSVTLCARVIRTWPADAHALGAL